MYFCSVLQCNHLLEEYEEIIEEFWFRSGLGKNEEEFHNFFCIENVKGMN